MIFLALILSVITDVIYDLAEIRKKFGLEKIDARNVLEILESHGKDPSNDNLIKIEQEPNDETEDVMVDQMENMIK